MKSNLCDAVEKVLITKSEIDKRIEELGKEITEEYKDKGELIVVGILRGAAMFMSNLALNIDLEVGIDFMAVSSYGHSSESSGTVRIIKDLEEDIAGKNILIVEDIVDSGRTLNY
ncbi:MAG: phosphoribosyltransferase family protein, partial [Finegoldia magna]|nr:phosphoribosyltransferase family protein [Finegoldia magna]